MAETVHVDGDGTPHPIEGGGEDAANHELARGEGDGEGEGEGWRQGLSEIRDQVSELTTATERKFTEFQQAISDRMTEAQTELRRILEQQPSTLESSPSEETSEGDRAEERLESSERPKPEKPDESDRNSESAKPAEAEKFRTVLKRRHRSI